MSAQRPGAGGYALGDTRLKGREEGPAEGQAAAVCGEGLDAHGRRERLCAAGVTQ